MLGGLGKGILFRLVCYAVFLLGFLLLFRAFEDSSILAGVAGGVAILAAMWLMVGFRAPSASSREADKTGRADSGRSEPSRDGDGN